MRRHHAKLAREAVELNLALKKEIERTEPQVWQGRASVELVHDLNNPLTVVIGYATLLAEEARASAGAIPNSGEAARLRPDGGARRGYCHHLSENWRLSTKKLIEMKRLDLVQIARDVQQVIFFGNVAIAISGAAEAPVIGSKFELMRVFQNIFKNALESGAHQVSVVFASGASGIEVVISDNGPGMDAESIRRALQGGFTSKASGTGLGLGICRHLVSAHGGTFDLKSEPGKGASAPDLPRGPPGMTRPAPRARTVRKRP